MTENHVKIFVCPDTCVRFIHFTEMDIEVPVCNRTTYKRQPKLSVTSSIK